MPKLYGDGIHDDYAYIQKMLNSGTCEVCLPAPKVHYLISKTLYIHGGQTLRLPRTAKIKLAKDSNCSMLENANFEEWAEGICIDGGVWDMNNAEQEPNPYHFPDKHGKLVFYYYDKVGFDPKTSTALPKNVYTGFCMRFCRVKNLLVKNLTLMNPVDFGIHAGYIENFTFRDIDFNYTHGSPKLWNMDGIHIEGHSRNGYIANLKGACHDDLLALTADDGLYGPIENIVVDGIYADGSHSAVRMLSHGEPIKNVSIRNVFGSYYVYCIGLTKYHGGPEERGYMENVSIENVYACACEGTKDVKGGRYHFLWVQRGVDVENLRIEHVYRDEKTYPTSTIKIDEDATVKRFKVKDVILKNRTGKDMELLTIDGKVEELDKKDLITENY